MHQKNRSPFVLVFIIESLNLQNAIVKACGRIHNPEPAVFCEIQRWSRDLYLPVAAEGSWPGRELVFRSQNK